MTNALTTPLIDLLFSAPNSMVPAVQDAMREVAAGEYMKASRIMGFAADAYEGAWHDQAQITSSELRTLAANRA